jgi:hypothetical protein
MELSNWLYDLGSLYTKFHPNLTNNTEGIDRNSLLPLSKVDGYRGSYRENEYAGAWI